MYISKSSLLNKEKVLNQINTVIDSTDVSKIILQYSGIEVSDTSRAASIYSFYESSLLKQIDQVLSVRDLSYIVFQYSKFINEESLLSILNENIIINFMFEILKQIKPSTQLISNCTVTDQNSITIMSIHSLNLDMIKNFIDDMLLGHIFIIKNVVYNHDYTNNNSLYLLILQFIFPNKIYLIRDTNISSDVINQHYDYTNRKQYDSETQISEFTDIRFLMYVIDVLPQVVLISGLDKPICVCNTIVIPSEDFLDFTDDMESKLLTIRKEVFPRRFNFSGMDVDVDVKFLPVPSRHLRYDKKRLTDKITFIIDKIFVDEDEDFQFNINHESVIEWKGYGIDTTYDINRIVPNQIILSFYILFISKFTCIEINKQRGIFYKCVNHIYIIDEYIQQYRQHKYKYVCPFCNANVYLDEIILDHNDPFIIEFARLNPLLSYPQRCWVIKN